MSCFLCMVEEKLPPGFRFHPRDDELVCDYLVPMVEGGAVGRRDSSSRSFIFYGLLTMVVVNLNKCEPWELPETARVGGKQWYFFSLHDRKYASGPRTNRATISGYWKATGKDRAISRQGAVVGMRKTLVFYRGRAPKGRKTEWVMHEFRLEGRTPKPQLPFKPQEEWVLCRVFCKSMRVFCNSMERSHGDAAGSAQCLSPPLGEDNYINFEDQPPMSSEGFEQVPCFSGNASHTGRTLGSRPHLQAPMETRSLRSSITRGSPLVFQQFGTLPEVSSHNNALNQYLSKLQEASGTKVEAPNAAEGTLGGLHPLQRVDCRRAKICGRKI